MDATVYEKIKFSVKKLLNIDLNYYKEEQVKRRLDSWLTRNDMPNWDTYAVKISKDDDELSRFRDYLTINVTEFFRDTSYWQTLQGKVLPELLAYASPKRQPIKIWSAGCSTGVEAYTLAMVMDSNIPNYPYEILASDMDRGALQKAKARGPYLAEEIRNLTAEQKMRYLTETNGKYFFKEQYARAVRFFEQDLLKDAFTPGIDLIVCRNVVIYFTREAKDMLYRKFNAALRPGGFLFVGGTELLARPSEHGFTNRWMGFYAKSENS
jgi:chemotaxis protein methyltransferase CheR